ncbi:MAG TPA: RNase adapter RapZ [Polyangiaceae bacterium]|nr:RNase adapter RapZ [Polyangiaceae bacterium]
MTQPPLVVAVTGLSGAGRTTALAALEDLGFFCIDNLPTPVLRSTVEALCAAGVERIGLGIDVRGRGFLNGAVEELDGLRGESQRTLEVVFVDASDEALLRRYSSTRRPHPLSMLSGEQGAPAVMDGLHRERELLAGLRARATLVIDTSALSVHELRRLVVQQFGTAGGKQPRLRTRVVSFGFKFGTPVDADIVLDVRFLKNPHFVRELRALPGTHADVRSYVMANGDAEAFVKLALELLAFSIPRFESEGRSYLTVAVGCTGGRHRSVVMAGEIARLLGERLGISGDLVHRDLDRVNMSGPGGDPDHGPPIASGGRNA